MIAGVRIAAVTVTLGAVFSMLALTTPGEITFREVVFVQVIGWTALIVVIMAGWVSHGVKMLAVGDDHGPMEIEYQSRTAQSDNP